MSYARICVCVCACVWCVCVCVLVYVVRFGKVGQFQQQTGVKEAEFFSTDINELRMRAELQHQGELEGAS